MHCRIVKKTNFEIYSLHSEIQSWISDGVLFADGLIAQWEAV